MISSIAALGLVDTAAEVALGHDQAVAGVSDVIAARRNNHGIGVTNRAQRQPGLARAALGGSQVQPCMSVDGRGQDASVHITALHNRQTGQAVGAATILAGVWIATQQQTT